MGWGTRTTSMLLCLCIILLAIVHNANAERKVVCYYTNWSIYRPGTAKFSPQNINPYLCTHLIYAFGGFTKDNALKPFDKYQDIEKGGYAKFTGLKTYNKNLKTLLAIGGWNEGSSRFSPMVASADRRRELVKNTIKFLRKNHFDGLDLDWEYPAFRDGGKPRDKENYATLVQELREEFERESSKTGRPRLLLTMAMPAGIEYIDKGYDVPRLNEYLDFINLLSYDYHSSYEPAVNHHSPLYPLEEDNEYNYDTELTIDYTVNYLLNKGASPEKIILGIPTYGRSYTLFNQDATELGSPADGPGVKGDSTREKGYLAYFEICESQAQSDEWEVVQPNPKAMGPYAFKGDQWIGYDDESMVKLKAKYANEKNLGGIMFWTIDNDDFRGKCHGRPYPLIEAAKEALLTDSTNVNQKSQNVDRKRTRTEGVQSNSIGKKSSGARRSTTTAAPAVKKRVSPSRPKYRTLSRNKSQHEEEEDQEVDRRSYDHSSEEEEDNSESKSRHKNRSNPNRNRRKQTRRKEDSKTDSSEESLSNKLTTPEPPTTPDPGTDFKCEDEGFFPHPRDCKKYFWCLESGPGGLGVVAHQFTCPSGLVFNKAADSCDYPRNVICPKSKPSTSSASTTRAPITAATSRTTYLYSTTRRPSTEKPDADEEYEYYDDEDEDEVEEEEKERKVSTTTPKPLLYKTINRSRSTTTSTTTTTTETPSKSERNHQPDKLIDFEDEEDPKVIKELIKLIKKAGGIEQLEKQLLFQEKSANETVNSGNDNATPATISRTLYERVLSRQAGKIGNRQLSSANGPGGAQFDGLDEVPEVKSLRRSHKPQYVTIERSKPSSRPPTEGEDMEKEDSEDDTADVASSEEQTVSNPFLASSTQRATPNYINIRRARPSTTTSRNENDVEERNRDAEEGSTYRQRRPNLSSKTRNNDFTEDGKEQESGSSSSEESSPTTKSRYVSVQRFRSTTPQPTEVVPDIAATSQEPVTEPIVSSESPKIEEKADTISTTTPLSVRSIVSSTRTVVTVEAETEEPISNATSSSSTESVKLVDDSATEILLTTAPASSSTFSSASTRASGATVSQPRPFGFNQRNRASTASTEPTSSSPLPAANEQTRSKVSISSRNNARSSFLPGRGRLRPRQEQETRNDPEQPESSTRASGRTRSRGVSRYTPPAHRSRNEESNNLVVRERARTTESTSTTVSATDTSRRKFRRPTSRTTTAESVKTNELEDSPIVRIGQGSARRNSPSRSRSVIKEDDNDDRITNIKVFRKPSAVNRDARTRYTRKRNNAEESTTPSTTVSTTSTTISTSIFTTVQDTLTDTTTVSYADSVDELDASITTTAIDSGIETTTESIVENEVVTVTLDNRSNSTEPTTVDSIQDFDANVIKIVFPANNDKPENANATNTKRRKVLLRKRPVASSTIASQQEESEDEDENKLVHYRRRKVIKRVRPIQIVSATEDDEILLRFESTSNPRILEDISTEGPAVSTTDYDVLDDSTRLTLETPSAETEVTEDFSDALTVASTILDNFTTESSTMEKEEETESTTSFLINVTELDNAVSETLPPTSRLETLPTTVSLSTTSLPSQANRRSETDNNTYYVDSRYVRKKFVRRRPVVASENASDRYQAASSTEKSEPEGQTKRRKGLFVRRRPVPVSSTTKTTRFVEEERDEEDTSSVINRADDQTPYAINLSTRSDSEDFWNRYTTRNLPPSAEGNPVGFERGIQEESETDQTERSTSPGNRISESRPRYQVPDSLKRMANADSFYPPSDSATEEAEEEDSRTRYQNVRQPRTRYKYREITRTRNGESIVDATPASLDSSAQIRNRFYVRRPTVSNAEATTTTVTETLIPAKKFDYAADAHRRQQSLRSSARSQNEDSTIQSKEGVEIQNSIDADYATTPSLKPLVTRLVTSVEESATTERQKILIKTKYSSLTSTTKIPLQSTITKVENTGTTTVMPSVSDRADDSSGVVKEAKEESANEIRQGQVERSTLPIEGEFLSQANRFTTTESHESSTIEIESVFSNLIGNRDSNE
ncbi:uncharacterized protein LOC117602013 [Osmia lignaria lignaria]|uniref:uncharacterized protein LOC117602013 n=1 Tax=Osmia lignaria lignaria TaxID=1437193 RepID=UPI00402BCD02